MKQFFKHFLLAAGVVMLAALTVSCKESVLVDLAEYDVSVKMIDGTMLEDGTILSVPSVRVLVSHPEAARRGMMFNAYAFDDRLSYGFYEGEAIVMPLEFEEFGRREYKPEFETDVLVTVVYGYDGSGGGPKTIFEQIFPLKFTVID